MKMARQTRFIALTLWFASTSCTYRSSLHENAGFSHQPHGVPPEIDMYRDDWPLPNRDYENTRATFKSAIDSSNVTDLTEAWQRKIEPAVGPFGSVTSNPLILGDTIYLQDMSSHVHCLNRETGEPRWVFRNG